MRVIALATTREILSGEELYSSYLTLVSGWSHTGVRLILHWCQADLAGVTGQLVDLWSFCACQLGWKLEIVPCVSKFRCM